MVVKIPNSILAFVCSANFLLLLLQLQVVIIIQAHIGLCRRFQLILDGFSLFLIVLGCFSLFFTLVSTVMSYYSYKLHLLHELRDTNLSYLSKDKINIRKFVLQFALKFLINIFVLTGKQGGVHSSLWKNVLNTNKR